MEPKDKENTTNVALGIDLGTTNTVAAIYRNGSPEIITNLDGERLIESKVFYSSKDLTPSVGKMASKEGLACPRNLLHDMKRIIGRSNDDVYVEDLIKNERGKRAGLKFVKGTNFPRVKLQKNNKETNSTVTAEDVSSEILKYVKRSAEVYLGFEVTDAVISIPAYFSSAQRDATKRAAEKVGFTVLKLITEPVAAAIYYTYGKWKKDTLLLMVDLGGGTLDVSLIKCTKDKFEVKSVEGDMFLGGRDFDEIIFEYLRIEIGKRFGNAYIDPHTKKGERFLHRLWKFAVNYKHALSLKQEFSIPIDFDLEADCNILITRSEFEKLSKELFDRIIHKVQQCLDSSGISVNEVDKVVLAGGSTRIPKIKERLTTMFNGREPYTDLNPDEAVALGASIHAALLRNNTQPMEAYELEELAPHSLGILAKYELMVVFIPKGASLPAYAKQVMETSENDQMSVIFGIYEGERKRCTHNKKLGDFVISNLPSGKAGQVNFEVVFLLDDNGILRVSALESQTKNFNQLEMKMNNLSLCENKMIQSLEYERLVEKEDGKYEEFYKFRLLVDTFCSGILYDVDKPSYRPKKDLIIKELGKFNRIGQTLPIEEITILKSAFDKFRNSIRLLVDTECPQ